MPFLGCLINYLINIKQRQTLLSLISAQILPLEECKSKSKSHVRTQVPTFIYHVKASFNVHAESSNGDFQSPSPALLIRFELFYRATSIWFLIKKLNHMI